MTWLKWILIALTVVVAALAVGGLLLPATAHVERTTLIDAPRPTVFAVVNSFARFNEWSPWHERDPATRYEFSGPAFGVGARMTWTSENPEVGSGSQEITASTPFELVEVHLDFAAQGTAQAFYRLTEVDGGTQVTWGFDTDFGFDLIGRYLGRFLFDDWIGPDYEHGLANLKTLAEALPKADWTRMDVAVAEVEEVPILSVLGRGPADQAAIWATLTSAFSTIGRAMDGAGIGQAGAPVAIARAWSAEGFEFEAGIPFAGEVDPETLRAAGIRVSSTPAGRVVQAVHASDYASIPDTYRRLEAFLAAHAFTPSGRPWETYLRNPEAPEEQQLITVISYPVEAPLALSADDAG